LLPSRVCILAELSIALPLSATLSTPLPLLPATLLLLLLLLLLLKLFTSP
jgi:hypothetical protein